MYTCIYTYIYIYVIAIAIVIIVTPTSMVRGRSAKNMCRRRAVKGAAGGTLSSDCPWQLFHSQ